MIRELSPFVSRKIWGGQNLVKWKSLKPDDSKAPVGETWEISTHSEGPSLIKDANQSLTQIANLNYLVKLIDTGDVLSVQVHPGDEYALKFENQKGKTECWLILHAEEGAGIYLGFKKNIGKKELKAALENKDDVSKLLNFVPVTKGNFFLVPSGAIHAIGKGVSLVEVQQSSGVTYRVWDWNRLENGVPRELHVEKTFDVLIDDPEKNTLDYFQYKENVLVGNGSESLLVSHPDFKVRLISLKANEQLNVKLFKSNSSIIILNGNVILNNNIHAKEYFAFYVSDEKNLILESKLPTQLLIIE